MQVTTTTSQPDYRATVLALDQSYPETLAVPETFSGHAEAKVRPAAPAFAPSAPALPTAQSYSNRARQHSNARHTACGGSWCVCSCHTKWHVCMKAFLTVLW